MFFTTLEIEDELGSMNQNCVADRSKVVVMLWFVLLFAFMPFSVLSTLCNRIILGLAKVVAFGEELLPRLTIRSLYIMSSYQSFPHFSFEDRILILVVPVPGYCCI